MYKKKRAKISILSTIETRLFNKLGWMYILFYFVQKKTHTENVPRKTRNLSEDLLFLIHALFKRDFYIVSYSPEHNTTERTKPDFVYICKSNHTSHLLAHSQKKGDV